MSSYNSRSHAKPPGSEVYGTEHCCLSHHVAPDLWQPCELVAYCYLGFANSGPWLPLLNQLILYFPLFFS